MVTELNSSNKWKFIYNQEAQIKMYFLSMCNAVKRLLLNE